MEHGQISLSYIRLTVSDVRKVSEWYSTRLNLSVLSDSRDAVIVGARNGGPALEIVKGNPAAKPEQIVLGFYVADISTAFRRHSDGGKINRIKKDRQGRRYITLSDPAGHTVELFTREDAGIIG